MNLSTKDEIKGSFHEVKGKVKETAGKVTNNPDLQVDWATMRTRFLSSVAVALIFGFPSPAHATTNAQLAIAGATQTNVTCPVTLQLSGIVVGHPNIPFEYWFVNARNGYRETTGRVSAMMPPTGMAQISGSITIGVSTDPAKESHVQLWASSPGQPTPTLSNEAAFSVSCRAIRPPQTAGRAPDPIVLVPGIGSMRFGPPVPVPSDLQSTLDATVCSDHAPFFGGLVCAAAIPAGHLALVWNYAPSTGYENLDGYRVYRVDGGQKTLALTQANGTDVKVATFDATTASLLGRCFAVSAYKGRSESAVSAPFCVGGRSTTQTVSLAAAQLRSATMQNSDDTGLTGALAACCGSSVYTTQTFAVGYTSRTMVHVTGDHYENSAYRTGLFFDTKALNGRSVYRAALILHVLTTKIGSSRDFADRSESCATNVGLASNAWWGEPGWINADFGTGIQPGRVRGPDLSIDVTKLVSDWVSGRVANYGLVLKGDSEDMGGFRNDSCLSTYADATLVVTSS